MSNEHEAIDNKQNLSQATAQDAGTADLDNAGPQIIVTISKDKMEAYLRLDVSGTVVPPAIIEHIHNKLAERNIVSAIDHDAIRQAVQTPGLQVTCARGQKPVDGTNAFITFYFEEKIAGDANASSNQKVDYKDLDLFIYVHENELLAAKTKATVGNAGYDVCGKPLLAKPGKDIPMPTGKNIRIENTNVFSMLDGHVDRQGNRVNVFPLIEIGEDVDLSTGNIHGFIGDIVIRGSVQQGFSVKVEGNIEIFGAVDGGTVEGKNVTVHMGIRGSGSSYIKASENITAKFIENCKLFAGNNVIVKGAVLHSVVYAGKSVIVNEQQSLVHGGKLSAGNEIRVKNAGNALGINTVLEVGADPLLREELKELRKELKTGQGNFEQMQKTITILRSMDVSKLPPEKQELFLKLTQAHDQLTARLDTVKSRLNELEAYFEDVATGKILISDTVYPGVKIIIGTTVRSITEAMKRAMFYLEDGEITLGPYY